MANILLAGGGTGGHIYPGFAVAERLGEMDPPGRVDFACTQRPIDLKILKSWAGNIVVQPARPFSVRPMEFVKFYLGWWRTRKRIREYLKKENVSAVLGLGGFGSGAAVYEGARLGLRTGFLQPDFVPGRANQWLSKYAGKIFVQWEGTGKYFRRPVEVVGVPLRKDICRLPDRGESVRQIGLQPGLKTLVVVGGSTGARSLNEAVVKVLSDLSGNIPSGWQILHITGTSDFDRIQGLYQGLGDWPCRVMPYCDRMDQVWSLADLAICRAGAITVAELTAARVPSLLLPYPYHRDNHQAKNGKVLVEAGAARLIEDDKVAGPGTVGELRQALQNIFFDDSIRQAMVRGAEALRRVDAAEKVAEWLIGK
jgi:UDP-N-acetylglucosamine--N-acetylmuramyl-(pentapeptide) pyrophosphoryl-undecaprenol N-acetylglucosamine transferase